jgi:hypothetical protein
MTAYISRLFSPVRPAGIRPRPRSRYEPDPETYFSADPIEVDVQAGPIPPVHALQRPAPRSTDGPQSRAGSAESVAAAVVSTPGPPAPRHAIAVEHTNPPAPPQRSDAPFELDYGDPRPSSGPHEPPPGLDVRASVVPPEAVPTAGPSVSDIPSDPVAAGRDRQGDDIAIAAPRLTGPLPQAEDVPVESTHAPVAHRPAPPAADSGIGGPPQVVSVTGPAAPPTAAPTEPDNARPQPATECPIAAAVRGSVTGPAAPSAAAPSEPDNARPGPTTQGPIAAAAPARATGATPITKSPDPVVRQTIINAITEPAREQTTEVVVHIDRIDVHPPTNSPPPPAEPRRARAAPTSLQAYLRSRSRRAGT